LKPPTKGYELEAWNSWCASKKVPATGSYDVTKADRNNWRRHRDDYVSRKLAEDAERLQISRTMATDNAAKTAELLQKAIAKPEHFDGNQAKFADWWADL
jgi:hypothetical protein